MENEDARIGQEVENEERQNWGVNSDGQEGSAPESSSQETPSQEAPSMEVLLEEQGLNLDLPTPGEMRQGIIATIRENEILVSIGTKSEGVISGRELDSIPSEERETFEVGMEIPVYVVAPEDQNGNVVLSYTRAREVKDWEMVEELQKSGDGVDSKIIGYNKGGLIVPVGGLRGFVPASQVSLLRRSAAGGDTPEQRWGSMVGEPIQVCVIEVDRERRRLILSERQALQETRESLKDRLLDEIEEGSVRTGRVTSLADFGAFVNIDGADGLVHMSEVSWERIQHPSEVLNVGDEVKVKVISVDRERKRIGLSIRQLQDDPWKDMISHLKEGMLVEGTVTHLTKFGAFASLGDDIEGLIHVSELSEQRVGHPKEVLHEGDVLTLRIIKIDPERHRIGLSLRKVDSPAYADLDWKMALAEEVGKAQEDDEDEETAIDTTGENEQAASPEEESGVQHEEVPAMLDENEQTVDPADEPVESPQELEDVEADAELEAVKENESETS